MSFVVFSSTASDPIREPMDPLVGGLREWMTLERGALAGSLTLGPGGLYAGADTDLDCRPAARGVPIGSNPAQ